MNSSLLAAAIATASVLSVATLMPGSPLVTEARAASGIQRCAAPDGTSVYTDKPCAAFGAEAVPMSGELLTRVAREQRMGQGGLSGGYADASAPLDAPRTATAARRSTAAGCARTPTQLAMDLRGSVMLGDVNRIAESYHWVGMDPKRAATVMERLEQLAAMPAPMVDTQYYNASIGSGLGGYASADAGGTGGSAGIMQLMIGDAAAPRVVDFNVQQYSGCYFVRF